MHGAIEVRNLTKSYGDSQAVRGIDFSVSAGEIVAFLGPNGAGKTTTVEILEGYRQRSGGEVSVLGHDPGRRERRFRERIGIVLQECGFPRWFTVRELLEMQAGYYPASRKVDEVLEMVNLGAKANERTRSLSGGQRRRLDLALALIGNPELLFLDEPTTGFDPSARRDAWELIARLRELGKTIFLTTHYMDEAQYLADRVILIDAGELVADGPPGSLLGEAASVISFESDESALGSLLLDGAERNGSRITLRSTEPTSVLHRLTAWAVDNDIELRDLTVARPSLEDVYLQLTRKGSR